MFFIRCLAKKKKKSPFSVSKTSPSSCHPLWVTGCPSPKWCAEAPAGPAAHELIPALFPGQEMISTTETQPISPSIFHCGGRRRAQASPAPNYLFERASDGDQGRGWMPAHPQPPSPLGWRCWMWSNTGWQPWSSVTNCLGRDYLWFQEHFF